MNRIEKILHDLCVVLGFCIPPKDQQRLIKDPPADADCFVNAVYEAEGFDPRQCGRWTLHRQVAEIVEKAFSNETNPRLRKTGE